MPQFTPEDVKFDLENLQQDIFREETEESWDKIANGLNAFTKICEEGGFETSTTEIINALRNFHRPIISAMNSERTRLSAAPLDLLTSVAAGLGSEFEAVLPIFLPPLLALCGRTNKVVINRAKVAIMTIIDICQLAGVLTHFLNNIKDKSGSLRLIIAECTLAVLNSCNPPDLEKEARAREIEGIIKGTARDANADVRKISRKIFESYKILLPHRVENFTAPLSPTMKKYLDVKPSATLATTKSTTNLRNPLNLRPEPKPSNSTTTVPGRAAGHSRTTSTSVLPSSTSSSNPVRNLATTLTRVTRNPPTLSNATSSGPIRPVQASRVVSETGASSSRPQRSDAPPARPASVQDRRAVFPVRPHVSTAQTASSTIPANRIQIISKPGSASGTSCEAVSSGPRRIAMPPPPPPASRKEKDGSQPPISRLDNTTQVQRPIVPPVKKTTSVLSPSLKDRLTSKEKEREPEKAKVSDRAKEKQKAKTAPEPPTTTTTTRPAKTTTKPPVPKARAAVVSASSSRTTFATKSTSVSNAMGPPPNPTAAAVKAKPQWGGRPAAKPVSVPVSKPGTKPVVKKPSSRIPTSSRPASQASKRAPTPAMVALPPSPEPTEIPAEVSAPVEQEVIVTSPADVYPEEPVAQQADEEAVVEDVVEQVDIETALIENNACEDEEAQVEEQGQMDEQSIFKPASDPQTPQAYLAPPLPAFALKTPISNLLASIEHGFLYSPSDPISPADTYLTDNGPHVKQVHTGPMQAFNYALHPSSDSPYGARNEELLQHADIGIMKVDPSRPYLPSSLMMDPERKAFYEINQ